MSTSERLAALLERASDALDVRQQATALFPASPAGHSSEVEPDDAAPRKDLERLATMADGSDFFGHRSFQPLQSFSASAIAALMIDPARGMERVARIGQLQVGGSPDGHRWALHGLLGRYDELEAWPPTDAAIYPPDLAARLAARDALLREELRTPRALARAIADGGTVAASIYRDKDVDHLLAGELALRAGDLEIARRRFARAEHEHPGFFGGPPINPAIPGRMGLARVELGLGRTALATKHVRSVLEIEPAHPPALLLAMATSAEMGMDDRARAYARTLRKHHPLLDDVVVDGISLSEVEARIGFPDRARAAYRAGKAALSAGDFDAAARELATAVGNGKLIGRTWTAAAELLVALASRGDHAALLAEADRLLRLHPLFLSAREARAYALARLGRGAESRQEFDRTGLGRLFEDPIEHAAWSARPVERALSPVPARAPERVMKFLWTGKHRAALPMLEPFGAKALTAELRFFLAGGIFRDGQREPARAEDFAAEAWSWIERVALRPHEVPALGELAADILLALRDWKTLVRIHLAAPDRSRSHARALPAVLEAHLQLGQPRRVIERASALFAADKGERSNARVLELLVRAYAALDEPLPSEIEWELPGNQHPDELGRRLSDVAWAADQRGDVDAAIDAYLEAAERWPKIGALGLSNAGNLAGRRGDAEAWTFHRAALALCSCMRPPARAAVLRSAAAALRERTGPADALPCELLAFEFEPSARAAAQLALDHAALGDPVRAEHYLAVARSIEPREPLTWRELVG